MRFRNFLRTIAQGRGQFGYEFFHAFPQALKLDHVKPICKASDTAFCQGIVLASWSQQATWEQEQDSSQGFALLNVHFNSRR